MPPRAPALMPPPAPPGMHRSGPRGLHTHGLLPGNHTPCSAVSHPPSTCRVFRHHHPQWPAELRRRLGASPGTNRPCAGRQLRSRYPDTTAQAAQGGGPGAAGRGLNHPGEERLSLHLHHLLHLWPRLVFAVARGLPCHPRGPWLGREHSGAACGHCAKGTTPPARRSSRVGSPQRPP